MSSEIKNAESYSVIGSILKSLTKLPLTETVFGVGAVLFYYVLFKSEIFPKCLSSFGIVEIVLRILTYILILLEIQKPFDTLDIVFNLPIAI